MIPLWAQILLSFLGGGVGVQLFKLATDLANRRGDLKYLEALNESEFRREMMKFVRSLRHRDEVQQKEIIALRASVKVCDMDRDTLKHRVSQLEEELAGSVADRKALTDRIAELESKEQQRR